MTAGEVMLVVAGVLCTLAFAALAITLVRVRDALGQLRADVAAFHAETARLLEEMRTTTDEVRQAAAPIRGDVARFALPSPEAINGRRSRTTLSAPMIKAAGIATGTTRAVRRLRRGA